METDPLDHLWELHIDIPAAERRARDRRDIAVADHVDGKILRQIDVAQRLGVSREAVRLMQHHGRELKAAAKTGTVTP